jgi:hypothetical protein
MPLWAYHMSPLSLALLTLVTVQIAALSGLLLVRRFVLPRLRLTGGTNDAVSGVVAVVGVFYGITVGLLAVGVWNTWASAADLVSKEAAAIGALYHDVSGYPAPSRELLQSGLREYTHAIVERIWPAQRRGQNVAIGQSILDDFQAVLHAFEPSTAGQTALHAETLQAYNKLIEYRRLRVDAVDSGLSAVMWTVIWVGALISLSVTYFYDIDDRRLHAVLVCLLGGFLALVIFTIGVNDKPFFGRVSIPPDSYTLLLERLIDRPR